VSDLFRQFALTIAIATLFSLLVSFSIVPLLSSRFGRLERLNPKSFTGKVIHAFENGINRLADSFSGLLKWSFSHKILVSGITLTLLIASLSLAGTGFIGSEFAPSTDQGSSSLPSNCRETQRLNRQTTCPVRQKTLFAAIRRYKPFSPPQAPRRTDSRRRILPKSV
jgi:multidrug efflux pump subunit AcrB